MELANPKTWADWLNVLFATPLQNVLLIMFFTAVPTWWLKSKIVSGQIKGLEQQIKGVEQRLELAKERAAFADKKEIDLTKAIERQKAKRAAAVSKWKAAKTPKEADSALVDLEAANDTSAEVDAALTELKDANDSVETALTTEPGSSLRSRKN